MNRYSDRSILQKLFGLPGVAWVLLTAGGLVALAGLLYGQETYPAILTLTLINLGTWLIGIGILLLIGDRLVEKGLEERDQINLVLELGSFFNPVAVEAARRLKAQGWNYSRHLNGAYLVRANLQGAWLDHFNFRQAKLGYANLKNTFLREADLESAILWNADLQGADLSKADLSYARFARANLQGARLAGANLHKAVILDEQLAVAYSLRGATMPDGSRYDGRYHLAGDYETAAEMGVDVDDPEIMSRWCQGVSSLKLAG